MFSDDYAKIAGPNAEFITEDQARAMLSAPSGSRPRIYALHEESGQIVKLTSIHYLEKYAPKRIWLSRTTMRDLIRPA